MKNDIEPWCLTLGTVRGGNLMSTVMVKLNSSDLSSTMEDIAAVWDEFVPNQHLRYHFLDDRFARMYKDVRRTGDVFSVFAILAVVVACLGLFGLSAFLIEQRSKEMSIRKILGASIYSIFKLLTLNFLKLIVLSLIIAIPFGYFVMDDWLTNFKYRITPGWDIFAIAGIMVFLIALATVSYESVKAALVNPTKGLRTE